MKKWDIGIGIVILRRNVGTCIYIYMKTPSFTRIHVLLLGVMWGQLHRSIPSHHASSKVLAGMGLGVQARTSFITIWQCRA